MRLPAAYEPGWCAAAAFGPAGRNHDPENGTACLNRGLLNIRGSSLPARGTPCGRSCPGACAVMSRLIPVVRLSGVIGLATPLKPGLTLANVARPLERAFRMRNARAVALLINSPGGSPVQSHLIYRRIRQLAAENNRAVLAFTERGCIRRLYDRLRRGRDHLRPLFDRGFDRCGRRLIRLRQADGQARHRAKALYFR